MNNASKKDEPSGNGPQRSVDHPTTMTWTIPIEITVSMPEVPVQVKVTSGKASIAGAEGRFSSLPPDSGFGKFEIGSLLINFRGVLRSQWPLQANLLMSLRQRFQK